MRARRRLDSKRTKQRAKSNMRRWGQGRYTWTPRDVGRNESTHCRPRSCWMCTGTPDVAPPRERAFDYVEDAD